MAVPVADQVYPVRLSEQMSSLKQRPRRQPILYRDDRQGYGLLKNATGILADQGSLVYVVTDIPKTVRSKSHRPRALYKGARPMHSTTLSMHATVKPDYVTTNQQFHGGKKDLESVEKVFPYPSQHITQFDLSHQLNDRLHPAEPNQNWATSYDSEFHFKGSDAPARLHYPSFLNKMNMNEGGGVKEAIVASSKEKQPGRFWSQYNRIHNRLGAALGPGVPQERPVRTSYDPLTGKELGPAWKENNHRISGNRVLYHNYNRCDAERAFMY